MKSCTVRDSAGNIIELKVSEIELQFGSRPDVGGAVHVLPGEALFMEPRLPMDVAATMLACAKHVASTTLSAAEKAKVEAAILAMECFWHPAAIFNPEGHE